MDTDNQLSKYQEMKILGKGSYGEAWLVQHKKDKKQYVLKKMELKHASDRDRKAAEQEAKLLSKLKHPNIVFYRDSFETSDGSLYVVTLFCEGGTLYNRLKEQKGVLLDERKIVEWFVQIAMALQYMHERNILHRDLKTQNIYLTKNKIIKLGDLGIARVLENSDAMATTLIGTPYYMSPELFSNKPYNHKSDVWALGCCVYEMTTLKHAFNAKNVNSLVYKILKEKMPQMPSQYTPELVTLIKSMLAQDPDKRPSVNRILRDQYIKKNIATFLENTKSHCRNTSGSRLATAQGPSPGNSPNPKNHSSSGKRPKKAGRRSSSSSSVQSFAEEDQKEMSPRKSSKRKKKGNHDVEEQPTKKDIFENPLRMEKPRPLPPLPASSGTPPKSAEKKRSSTEGCTLSPREDDSLRPLCVEIRPLPPPLANGGTPQKSAEKKRSSTESCTLSPRGDDSPCGDDSPKSRPNTAARARRREKKRNSIDIPTGPPGVSDRQRWLSQPEGHIEQDLAVADLALEKKEAYPHVHGQMSQVEEYDVDGDEDTSMEEEKEGEEKRNDREMNNFISMLSNTLVMNKEEDVSDSKERERGDEFDVDDINQASSKETPKSQQLHRALSAPGIGARAESSSGRLMEKINVLRRDCVRGLGVEKLHKAYEILDNDEEEEQEPRLVALLGKDDFDIYAGKISELKFCEEIAFGLN